MIICAVANCISASNSKKNKKDVNNSLSFHTFPKNPDIRQKWIAFCKRADKYFNPSTSRICSLHFTSESFEADFQAKFLNIKKSKRLVKDAIPTIYNPAPKSKQQRRGRKKMLDDVPEESAEILSETELLKSPAVCNRGTDNNILIKTEPLDILTVYNPQTGEDVLIKAEPLETSTVCNPEINNDVLIKAEAFKTSTVYYSETDNNALVKTEPLDISTSYDPETDKDVLIKADSVKTSTVCDQETENDIIYKTKYENLLKNEEQLKFKLRNFETLFKEKNVEITSLKNQITELTRKNKLFVQTVSNLEQLISKVLTKAQRNKLENDKKWVVWNEEDISKAFTLRYLSQKSYNYLKTSLNYPLPHLSTIRKWTANLSFRNGMYFMKIAGSKKTKLQKVCVMVFDEMKINEICEYDSIKDEIIGPYKYMQVIMVRGLFDQWKQPIYVEFDQKITKDVLMDVIKRLHEIDYDVVACTSNCSELNVDLWNPCELDITPEKSYFLHPVTREKVFMFPDVPQLLKLIGNWLLDSGFRLEDDNIVNKEPLEFLVKMTDTEISSTHKVTEKHLICKSSDRQNVGLAKQLISHSTGKTLIKYQPGLNKDLAINTGNFILTVATWFDIMNTTYSCSQGEDTNKPKPYGYKNYLKKQNENLDKIFEIFSTMRCIGKGSLQTFQKAVIISTKSIKGLYDEMVRRYNSKYIITHRLNQDCLENFFSLIRASSGLHDHPTPLQAMYRIRLIILGKNTEVTQNKSNNLTSASDNNEQFLSVSIISAANIKLNQIISNKHPLHEELDLINQLSETVSSSLSSNTNENISEKDSFQYLCGYIARIFKIKYPEMGKYSKDTEIVHSYCQPPDWLQFLSFGELITPSEKWLHDAGIIEKYFEEMHREGFVKKPGITQELMSIIKLKSPVLKVPTEVLKSYIIQRYYIRIKFLNRNKEFSKVNFKRKIDNIVEPHGFKKLKKHIS